MVKRFMAPGPWITRDLKECVRASDYDALAAERDALRELLQEALPCVESWQRKHERAYYAAKKKHDSHHMEWHRNNVANALGLKNRIDAAMGEKP